jgi:hypothetical protein
VGEWRVFINVQKVEQAQAVLVSHPDDVELQASPDGLGFYLHSAAFDTLADTDALNAYAKLIQRINGLGRIQHGTDYEEIKLRQLTRIENDRPQFAMAVSNWVGPVLLAEEEMPLSLPAGLPALEAHPGLAEAVEAYSSAQSMADLYGVYEILRKDVAGSQTVIDAWAGGKPTRHRFTWSAQQGRHARPSQAPLENPMGHDEAHVLIRKLLWTALESVKE